MDRTKAIRGPAHQEAPIATASGFIALIVALDDERKAPMVSKLMPVLCSESDVQPVSNTRTLYT